MQPDDNILSIISNANSDSIYLADVDTYELIYLNPTACQLAGLTEEDYLGQKCYRILQGLDAPCPFCTNHLLSDSCFYTWDHYNASLGRQFMLRDRLVEYEGRLVRMEIATDVTHLNVQSQELTQLQAIDEALVLCIDTLRNSTDTDHALNSLLAYIGMFYRADHAYIYEIDHACQALVLTYSWIRGNFSTRHHHKFDLSRTAEWFDALAPAGVLSIPSVEESLDHDSLAYQSLHEQQIHSVVCATLPDSTGNPIGLICVGNLGAHLDAPRLLSAVSSLIVDALSKRSILARLDKLSYSDTLTGLNNRHRYLERLQEFQIHAPPSLGIICLDIDGMKRANDTYGHAYGDAMLVRTANILASLFEQDVYRVGGDQFVVLCPNVDQQSFQHLTEQLRRMVKESDDLSISIGSKWSQDQSDAAEQALDADKLMALEKQSHYHAMRGSRESFYRQLKQKLDQELRDGLFSVVLQPQISLKTGQVVGAEALVRKRGSAGEMVSPAMFVPLYEKEGLIRDVDFFVLEQVCQILAQWETQGLLPPKVSVNFSRITLLEENFVENVSAICQRYQVPPQRLGIEITESSTKMDLHLLSHLVKRLRALGFCVSLDDFGTCYSNLAVLTKIDFDCIKIDKSLVDSIVTNPKAHTIVAHTISMGRALSCTASVAEGIETSEQLKLLSRLQCDVGQGYYFSRPISIQEFTQRYLC